MSNLSCRQFLHNKVIRTLLNIYDGALRENSIRLKAIKTTYSKVWSEIMTISLPEVFLGKGGLEICSKYSGEYPCRSMISIKLLCSFIEIARRHGCSSVNLLHIFRTTFYKNSFEGLLLDNLFSRVLPWNLVWQKEQRNYLENMFNKLLAKLLSTIVYRNTWLGNAIIISFIKPTCWN